MLLLFAVSISIPAQAATHHGKPAAPKTELVTIRASDHAELTRLLITWPHTPDYQFTQAGDTVTVSFARTAKADLGDTAKLHLRDIISFTAAVEDKRLVVQIKLKPGSKATAFKIGDNVIVDAADPTGGDMPVVAADAAKEAPADQKDKPAETPVAALHFAATDGIAVFKRGDFLWVATPATVATPPMPAGPQAGNLGPGSPVPATGGTIYRYRLKEAGLPVVVQPVKEGWDIAVGGEAVTQPGLIVKPETDLNRLRIGVAGAGKAITASDPEQGNPLQIVPAAAPVARMERLHVFPEINILPSAQGIVFLRKSDGVTIESDAARVVANRVSALNVVAGTDDAPLFFDFATWRQGGLANLWAYRAARQMKAATEPASSQAASDILDLARAYAANGLGSEAYGYLTYAQSLQPALADSPDFIALQGVAAALAGRPDIALPALANGQLQTQAELRLWRGYAEADGTPAQQDDALALLREGGTLINRYPVDLQTRVALKLALLAVYSADQPSLQEAINVLQNAPVTPQTQAATAVLKASLLSLSPTPEQAIAAYDQAAKTSDPYWQAIASFLAVRAGLRDKTMPAADAIKRLDSLRYAWRGDEMERQTLLQLGSLYLDQGNFTEGSLVLRDLIELAPDTPFAIEAKAKIVATVKQAFSAEHGTDYSPLDVLAFYDSAADILPPDTLSSADFARLSQRLADIGLMDRAADFLEPQLKVSQDAAKAELGARIAVLRLLDDHPEAALTVLADSAADKASEALKTERKLLQARAMSKTGKPFEALVLLQGTNGREADALRVDIAWGVQNWKEAAEALGRLVGPVQDGKVSDEQSNIILNEAVAMSLEPDPAGLTQLSQNYGGPMLSTPRGNAFALLTSPSTDTRAPNVDAVKATVSGLDIFQNFLAGYHKSG